MFRPLRDPIPQRQRPGELDSEGSEAAGINRPDVLQRRGLYAPPPGASDLPGLEAAGTVYDVGAGVPPALIGQRLTALCPGRRLCGLCRRAVAACLAVAGEPFRRSKPLPCPKRFSPFMATWSLRGRLTRGRHRAHPRWLIRHRHHSHPDGQRAGRGEGHRDGRYGGKGGGLLGTGRGPRPDLPRYGNGKTPSSPLTDGKGVDVILDMVAGDYVARGQKCLAVDGRLVIIAVQGGTDANFHAALAMVKRQTFTGSTLRPQSIEAKDALAMGLNEHVWPLLNNGTIKPVIHATFPLEQASDAHAMMEGGAHIGKIVLTVGD